MTSSHHNEVWIELVDLDEQEGEQLTLGAHLLDLHLLRVLRQLLLEVVRVDAVVRLRYRCKYMYVRTVTTRPQ